MASLFFLLCLCSLASASAVPTAQPTVTISSGPIIGTTTALPSATAVVNKFLGVPFAASPPQRFSPPTKPSSWTTPYDATALKPACIQQFNYPESSRNFTMNAFNNPPPPESEDCLYLNVYAPSSKPPCEGRAVLFWIYGGNLQFGYAGLPSYDGSSLANSQNVVVVTINYRTNVFGFPNSPELPVGSQNPGFLDQRQALSWVQENIGAFGGDPKKVTIFGESAGGYSVKQLVSVPPNPLTFRAAIMQSEATGLDGGVSSWQSLVVSLGCTAAASQLACIRTASATDIKSIIEHDALAFPPTVDNQTETGNVTLAIASHTAAQVPILIGTNSQEGANTGRVFAVGTTNVTSYLDSIFPGQTAFQAAIVSAYPPTAYASAFEIVAAIITDLTFQCPAATLANLTSANGHPTWRYYFNASFPNTQLFPGAGVYHASEIPEVFGTYPAAGATEQQITLSKVMQSYWANFAKNPTSGPGWPKLGTNHGKDLEDLGGNGRYGGYPITQASVDYRCPVYAPIIAAQGL